MPSAKREPEGKMSAVLEKLRERSHLIWNLYATRSLLNWDQQVNMPVGGSRARSAQSAAVERVAHEMLVDPRFVKLLENAEEAVAGFSEDSEERCFVEGVRRRYNLAARVPADLVEELAKAQTTALDAWEEARRDNDFPRFRPHLERVFELTRRVAEHRGYVHHPYDALLDEYEPGMLTSDVEALFEGMQPGLTRLVERIAASPQVDTGILEQAYPVEGQRQVAHQLLQRIGFDFARGRLDTTSHPFCSAYSYGDVRLTDRYDERQVTMCIFGALHEGGHGLYEQGSPPEFDQGPLRGGCSLGVHESQSRLWENFIGRGQPFWNAHWDLLRDLFPQQLGGYRPFDFWRASCAVRPSFIRVEADEVTYTLHIILRFQLEKALLTGDLKASDLPAAWNEKMRLYLGITPPDDRLGCLQDIHWSFGLIGYFPTYSIGNLLAAQMWQALRRAYPDLDERLGRGDTACVLDWLRQNLHVHASKYPPKKTILKCLGQSLDYRPFLEYLEQKYSAIYVPNAN